MAENWVRTVESGDTWMESLDGVNWGEGRIPWRLHRCRPQSRGYGPAIGHVERCMCGAARYDGDPFWLRKNEARKHRARQRREDRLPRVQVTCQDCGSVYEAPKGTRQASDQLCTTCWGLRFVGSTR